MRCDHGRERESCPSCNWGGVDRAAPLSAPATPPCGGSRCWQTPDGTSWVHSSKSYDSCCVNRGETPPPAPSPSPRAAPEPGSDARSLPDGTLVTCEHCPTPHPKGDDGRPCRFPRVAAAPEPDIGALVDRALAAVRYEVEPTPDMVTLMRASLAHCAESAAARSALLCAVEALRVERDAQHALYLDAICQRDEARRVMEQGAASAGLDVARLHEEISKLSVRAAMAESRASRAEGERDEARKRLNDWQAKVASAEHDGGSGCSYCHGVGACPRCWGRAGIERAESARARAEEEAGRLKGALDSAAVELRRAYDLAVSTVSMSFRLKEIARVATRGGNEARAALAAPDTTTPPAAPRGEGTGPEDNNATRRE